MNLKSRIKNKLEKQLYKPDWLGVFVNPNYIMRRGLYENIEKLGGRLEGKVLDAGCGTKPYVEIFKKVEQYVGMEFDTEEARIKNDADIFYDGEKFPFGDTEFDGVIATEVLEHVFNPDQFLDEVNRVLKSGGRLLITTPFVYEEHCKPHDYGRYSSFGIKSILQKHGFDILEHNKIADSTPLVIAQLLNTRIYKKFWGIKNYKVKLLVQMICDTPITILGLLFSKIAGRNSDLYLNNAILATKIN